MSKKEKRFNSLYFQGPVFPEEYEVKGYSIAGEKLPALAEEMLWACAAYYLHEDYWDKLVKMNNFWQCLKPELTDNQKKLSFPKDFETVLADMKKARITAKEEKKRWEADHKLEKKQQDAEKVKFRDEHNFCIIDDNKVKCPYTIEGPGLIMTHGDCPRFGSWKYRVKPEDVTLNIVKNQPPKGWKGKVVSSPTSQWVFKYYMDCGRKDMKSYMPLSKKANIDAKSDICQGNASKKFDKTMKAIKKYSKIEKKIEEGLKSKDVKTQQAAAILWLLAETGIRIGNEKNLDQHADTVGASTLKVENIILN